MRSLIALLVASLFLPAAYGAPELTGTPVSEEDSGDSTMDISYTCPSDAELLVVAIGGTYWYDGKISSSSWDGGAQSFTVLHDTANDFLYGGAIAYIKDPNCDGSSDTASFTLGAGVDDGQIGISSWKNIDTGAGLIVDSDQYESSDTSDTCSFTLTGGTSNDVTILNSISDDGGTPALGTGETSLHDQDGAGDYTYLLAGYELGENSPSHSSLNYPNCVAVIFKGDAVSGSSVPAILMSIGEM